MGKSMSRNGRTAQNLYFNLENRLTVEQLRRVAFLFRLVSMNVETTTESFTKVVQKNKVLRLTFNRHRSLESSSTKDPLRDHTKEVLLMLIRISECFERPRDLNELLENCAIVHRRIPDFESNVQTMNTLLLHHLRKEYAQAYTMDKEVWKYLEMYLREVKQAILMVNRNHPMMVTASGTSISGQARTFVHQELRQRETQMIDVFRNVFEESSSVELKKQ